MANMQTLKAGTVLSGKEYTYTIRKVLGQGAFGITYLADTVIKGPLGKVTVLVALKEFFAKELDSRSVDGTVSARTEGGIAYKYAKAFRRESENLSKMDHPGIVNVLESFDANGTCYYSMEYLSGGSLDEKVKGKGISEAEALPIIAKIGEAVSYMHERKMMHLDLKPKNVMLKDDGTPVVIDFGLSKQYDDNGEPESSSSIGLGTLGYAPLEQANQTSGKGFQPTLDIYALGATLYKMLTGETPPDASSILEDGLPEDMLKAAGVSDATVSAISEAMCPNRKYRTPSVSDFLSMLGSAPTRKDGETDEDITVPKPVPEPEPAPEPEPKPNPKPEPKPVPEPDPALRRAPKPKTWLWALLGGIAAAVIAGVILGGRIGGGNDTPVVQEEDQVASSNVMAPSNTINGHEYVDLGLSVKWATMNVGATSPEEFGDYFAWGETEAKHEYSLENYTFYVSGEYFDRATFRKYNTKSRRGPVDNKIILDLSDDAARAIWGGTWRMPTQEEIKELVEKCTWSWSKQYSNNGYKVTSKSNGNSIFLPAAGTWVEKFVSMDGSEGFYLSSSLFTDAPHYVYSLYFTRVGRECGKDARFYGLSIRPVSK